jgi:hypothetical protein
VHVLSTLDAANVILIRFLFCHMPFVGERRSSISVL